MFKVPSQGSKHHVQSHDSGLFSQESNTQESDYIPPNQEAAAQAGEQSVASSSSQDVEMASGSSGHGGSGGVAEPGGTGISRLLIGGHNGVNKGSHTFRRSYEVNTINYANAFVPTTSLPESHRIGNSYVLLTPMAAINPNNLEYYCHLTEWEQLPESTWAKRCKISCTPLSYRTSFETGSTNVGSANSQMPVNIQYAVGLNKYLVHGMAPLISKDMIPSNTQAFTSTEDKNLWNKFNNGIRTLQSPALVSYAYFPSSSNTVFSQDLSKYVTKENLITAKGHKVIDYEYNFKVAPLKLIKNPFGLYNTPHNKFPLAQQTDPMFMSGGTTNPDPSGYLATNSDVKFTYYNGIEKAQFMTMEAENTHTSDAVPFIYIGGQAVLSSMPGSATATFSNVYVQWKVDVELDVEWNINYSDLSLRLLPHFTPMYARILQNKLTDMHAWDSAGHQMAFIGGRFYNANTSAGKLDTVKKNEVKKRVARSLTADFLHCDESLDDDFEESQPVTKTSRGPYQGVLKKNEGIKQLFDL